MGLSRFLLGVTRGARLSARPGGVATLGRATTIAVALFVAWGALAGSSACTSEPAMKWPSVKKIVHKKFPSVRELSTVELAEWLSTPDRTPPLLLDARAPAEFAVSHLAGAQSTPTAAQALSLLNGRDNDEPIVVYCSVGYRSAAVAERLQQAGFTQVQNLAGSIFEWANEGRPVYRDGQLVRQVHPYDEKWGVLLDRNLWATTPPG